MAKTVIIYSGYSVNNVLEQAYLMHQNLGTLLNKMTTHSIHKLQKNFALKRKKTISKELKLGSDNDATKSKILLR